MELQPLTPQQRFEIALGEFNQADRLHLQACVAVGTPESIRARYWQAREEAKKDLTAAWVAWKGGAA